ncbi:Crp/Fnr family transcriptional regulator [uncultured Muribaculum sp.]|uniref:Crp/Fnr family transcriptional regulator n=1 Tax=uncultured Muribaculum sp. TaxID=1918613 RepID=UPI00261B0556|nr:Crp/Fnr family transcriptional regulator [uncultured Muribaculum sp.]
MNGKNWMVNKENQIIFNFCIIRILMAKFNTYIEHPEIGSWRDLCVNEGELCRYTKGKEFVSIGRVARYIGYVKSGTLKYIAYDDSGAEHIVGLEFAGEFVADFPFSLRGEPSRVAIVADSVCEIYQYSVRELTERLKSDAGLSELVTKSTELLFSQTYDRYIALYCQSPEKRYYNLIANHPDLFELFSLKDIASFLNVTPTYLSRIRKKLGK